MNVEKRKYIYFLFYFIRNVEEEKKVEMYKCINIENHKSINV